MKPANLVHIVSADRDLQQLCRSMEPLTKNAVQLHEKVWHLLEKLDWERVGGLILDLRADGLQLVELLKHSHRTDAVIQVVAILDIGPRQLALKRMELGASQLIEKSEHFVDVELQDTNSGYNDRLRKHLARMLFGKNTNTDPGKSWCSEVQRAVSRLSPREVEVMQLLINGLQTKQIAARLCVSPKTVDHHRKSVLEKMHVDNVVELVRYVYCLDGE